MSTVGSWMSVPDTHLGPLMRVITVLEAYRKHIEERAALGIVPQPLNAEQTAGLIELLKNISSAALARVSDTVAHAKTDIRPALRVPFRVPLPAV